MDTSLSTSSPEVLDMMGTNNLITTTTTFPHYSPSSSFTDNFINFTSLPENATSIPTPKQSSGPSMIFRFICEFCIVAPIALFGFVGNVLAIIVLYRQKQRQGTMLFLQALAVADTSVLLTSLILRSLRYLCYYTEWDWLAPYLTVYPYIFRWTYPMVYFFRLIDTWLVVLLTVDRYIAVRHPLHAQRLCTYPRAIKNLIALIIISLLFSLPRFFEYEIDLGNHFGFKATSLMTNGQYNVGYRMIGFFFYQYLLPMLLLIALNTELLRTLRNAELYRAQIAEGNTSRSRSVTATVVTVVLVAIVCNMTTLVAHLLWSLSEGFEIFTYLELPRRYASIISNIFVTINSAVNFCIYCLCSRNFRTVLIRLFRCYPNKGMPRRGQSSMRTTGTYISLAHTSTFRKKPTSINVSNAYLPNKLYG